MCIWSIIIDFIYAQIIIMELDQILPKHPLAFWHPKHVFYALLRWVTWYLLVLVSASKHESSSPFSTNKAELQFTVKECLSQHSPPSCTCDYQSCFYIKRCCQWFQELIFIFIFNHSKVIISRFSQELPTLNWYRVVVPVIIFLSSSSSPCPRS